MTRTQIIYLHLSTILTVITGAVFALMKYGMESDDPFAVVNHPLQPHALHLHVLAAPLLTFALGWTFANHIVPKFRTGNGFNRRSGTASMWLIAPMTLSGYLLQISTADAMRNAMAVTHWVTSAIFLIAYAVHVISAFLRKKTTA